MPTFEGTLVAPPDARFAIVASRFNEMITQRLLDGAQAALVKYGVAEEAVDVAWCPGAFEIPVVAKTMADTGQYAAVVCLGAVVRGATPHFDYISGGVASGIQQVMVDTGVPVLFGVLTVDTIEQAIERAGTEAGNKGADAATGAIEMANLLRQLRVD